jgi:hypothetical protein
MKLQESDVICSGLAAKAQRDPADARVGLDEQIPVARDDYLSGSDDPVHGRPAVGWDGEIAGSFAQ